MSKLARVYIHDRTEFCILLEADSPCEALKRFDELVETHSDWRKDAEIIGGTVRVHCIELETTTHQEDSQ